ncbi:hypothetical protein EJB05_44360, partial [Eragrostis curvula]
MVVLLLEGWAMVLLLLEGWAMVLLLECYMEIFGIHIGILIYIRHIEMGIIIYIEKWNKFVRSKKAGPCPTPMWWPTAVGSSPMSWAPGRGRGSPSSSGVAGKLRSTAMGMKLNAL